MGGTPIQDPQHFIERLTKCDCKRRLNIVSEAIPWTKCSSRRNRALPKRFAARISQRCRMTRERRETETERFGWECAHHLFNE
jgi:hypothetical protein